MPDPAIVPCPADVWTKVATDVLTGILHKKKTRTVYLQTYRLTGNPDPTLQSEGVPAFPDGPSEGISSNVPIDVWIFAVGKAGSVRVDV